MSPERFASIVAECLELLDGSPDRGARFRAMKEEDLIGLHHGLGTAIRNRFKLWEEPWEPEIRDGVDVSPDHPDAISQRVIVETWRQANRRRET